mgnify:CR=1 FL=1
MAKKWIKGAIGHPGALHRDLGVPEGEKIPEDKLRAALHSKDPTIRKRANLAMTLKGMHHDGKKKHRSAAEKRHALYGEK